MKTLILALFLTLLIFGNVQSQSRSYQKLGYVDSLSTTFTVDIRDYLYNEVTFETLVSGNKLTICNMRDSISATHPRDTIPCYLNNVSTFDKYASGVITGLAAPLGIAPFITVGQNLYFRWISGARIYFRVTGRTY